MSEMKEKTFTKNVENGPENWEDNKETYNPLKDHDN